MSVFRTAMNALDKATAIYALAEIDRLAREKNMTELEQATAIIAALGELRKLAQPRGKPDYGSEWLPPLYALWYHNSHTQMAYHLAKAIPSSCNPLLTGQPDSLYVHDFACGTMAMQFAAAILGAEHFQEHGQAITISMQSNDVSIPMLQFGRGLWKAFYNQVKIGDQDEFSRAILRACSKETFPFVFGYASASSKWRWLTALHAVTGTGRNELKEHLGSRVSWVRPDVIVTTTHTSKATLIHGLPFAGYENVPNWFESGRWNLEPFATSIDIARKTVFEKMIKHTKGLTEKERISAQYLLVSDSLDIQRRMPQETATELYIRKDSQNG